MCQLVALFDFQRTNLGLKPKVTVVDPEFPFQEPNLLNPATSDQQYAM